MRLLYKNVSLRKLFLGKKRINGKNLTGNVMFHRGGGHKRCFRLVDYLRYIWNVYGIVIRFEYDPFRKVTLVLVAYSNGILTYNLSSSTMHIGYKLINAHTLKLQEGFSTYIYNIQTGLLIHNIEIMNKLGGQYVRSKGMFAKLISKNMLIANVKFKKSQRCVKVGSFNVATLGSILQLKWKFLTLKKAGSNRILGRRPHVRGYAKNPVDHPHGGRTKSGLQFTPWGKLTKGKKTRK